MDRVSIFHIGLLLVGVFISAISQVMLKKAASKHYDSPVKEYLNPMVMFAYIIFIGTTFLSIFAYRGIPLSMGPVLEATSYIYVTFFGVKVFKEKINGKKVLALGIIVLGIVVYSLSANN